VALINLLCLPNETAGAPTQNGTPALDWFNLRRRSNELAVFTMPAVINLDPEFQTLLRPLLQSTQRTAMGVFAQPGSAYSIDRTVDNGAGNRGVPMDTVTQSLANLPENPFVARCVANLGGKVKGAPL